MNPKWILIRNACLFLILGAPLVFGQAALDKRTSLDVNAVSPTDVFGSLAQTLGCDVEIDPAVNSPVSMRLPNVTVRTALNVICESIGCGWRLAGNTLHIDPTPAREPKRVAQESIRRILDQQTPVDFRFQNTPLKNVLEALSKASGIEITAEEPDASRSVTVDLSSRSILSALKEIGQSTELKSGLMLVGFSGGPGKAVKIKFAPQAAPKGAKKLPDKAKGE